MLKEVVDFGKKFVIAKSDAQVEVFNVGDTITVGLKIVDGNTTRVQDFTGVCIAYRKKGVGTNFIVRKMSGEVAVERTVMLYSPLVAYVKVKRKGVVRRAKLYYMRNLRGKAARIKEKIDLMSAVDGKKQSIATNKEENNVSSNGEKSDNV